MAAPKTSPSKEQFCSFISEFIDKSKKIIVESEDVLDYDAVELTLLLKSIGFQLQLLEFVSKPDLDAKDIEIEIKCKKSGLHSKLKMIPNNCTCPANDPESSNNNSFWEVQGIAPTSKTQGLIQDTSCNLLPEITKKTNNLARTMLTILQQHYKADFDPKGIKIKQVDIKEVLERFQAKNTQNNEVDNLKPNTDTTECISPNPTEHTSQHCSTPLSSINPVGVPNYDKTATGVNLLPEILGNNQTIESANGTAITEENLTTDTDKQYLTTVENLNSIDQFSNSVAITISEDTFDQLNSDNEKEICLIESITEARKNLDTALLLLKCNVTREISPGSSILTVTPQNLKKKLQSKKDNTHFGPASLTQIADRPKTPLVSTQSGIKGSQNIRRHSFGGRNDVILTVPNNEKTKLGGNYSAVDILKTKSKFSPMNGRFRKPDTPRPPTDKKPYGIEASLVKKALSGSHMRATALNTNLIKKDSKMTAGAISNGTNGKKPMK